MQQVAVTEQLARQYPDCVAFEAVGTCMAPLIKQGEYVVVSKLPSVKPGRVVMFELPRRPMPMLGVVYEVGRMVEGYTMDNSVWRCLPDDVVGVVVAVVG